MEENFDTKFHRKKEQTFEIDLSIKLIEQNVQLISQSLTQMGTAYQGLSKEIYKFYLMDNKNNMYQSAAKQISQAFKQMSTLQNDLLKKVGGISKHFQKWNKSLAIINENDVAFVKVKKDYDHYNLKLQKLRQLKNIKIAKQQPETIKEQARLKRNELKFAAARTAYNKNIETTYNQMENLFIDRFKQSNPYLCDLISILEEFFERGSGKLQPISNTQEIFEKDSKNTLAPHEERKDPAILESQVQNNQTQQSQITGVATGIGASSITNKISETANSVQQNVSQKVSQAEKAIAGNETRRKSIVLLDSDEEERLEKEKKEQERKQEEERQKQIELEKQKILAESEQNNKLKQLEMELKLKEMQLEQQKLQQQQMMSQNQFSGFQNNSNSNNNSNNTSNNMQYSNIPNLNHNNNNYIPNNNNILQQQNSGGNSNEFASVWDSSPQKLQQQQQKQFQSQQQQQPQQQTSNDFSAFDDFGSNNIGQNVSQLNNQNNITTFAPPPANTITSNLGNNNNTNTNAFMNNQSTQNTNTNNNNTNSSQAQSAIFNNTNQGNFTNNNSLYNQNSNVGIVQTNTVYMNQQQQQSNNNNNFSGFDGFPQPPQSQFTQQKVQNNTQNTQMQNQQNQNNNNNNNPFLEDLI